jgi:hypothetical protein
VLASYVILRIVIDKANKEVGPTRARIVKTLSGEKISGFTPANIL